MKTYLVDTLTVFVLVLNVKNDNSDMNFIRSAMSAYGGIFDFINGINGINPNFNTDRRLTSRR